MPFSPPTLPLPKAVHSLWLAQQELARHYGHTELRFTLDGRLVGDIAEAVALEHFGLLPPKAHAGKVRTAGVDAFTKNGDTVQIKASGNKTRGPAFSPGKAGADYLIFMHLDFEACLATVIYNGKEQPIRDNCLPKSWTGTKSVSLAKITEQAQKTPEMDKLPLVRQPAP